jgi:hypothetical protein
MADFIALSSSLLAESALSEKIRYHHQSPSSSPLSLSGCFDSSS